ncbi:electron transfer flavoprotein subunit beta/FixA family protein [Cryobacterium sp. Y50]|uniref:electron transfer flavoprotein subunit beta/FixA family protein n=1 Tax=Cryobacterium sp. Y50 TaxID=2048286 RepID=UPI000CE3FE92|nr:electron transfer flavoprotein subunit beta/FixA family protein [Cryobacterium sp. Y50]
MKIIVLVKQVPDTYGERKLNATTGILDRAASEPIIDEISERALEVALRYRDSHKGTEVVLLGMGPASVTAALRKALALGADSAVHVLDDALAGADMGYTAAVLAAATIHTGYDLVIAGNESTDGRGGVIPSMIAEHLQRPSLTFLDSLDILDERVSGVRRTETGTVDAHAALPAIVSITELAPDVRFPNFKGILSAKKKPLTVLALADLGLDTAALSSRGHSIIAKTEQRPSRTAGTKVADDGNAGVDLADFLAARHLI